MRAVGVIRARWGSTRFPGKSLAMICSKPLVRRVVERGMKARLLDEVIVATDDARIADAVKGTGARAVMTRADHESGTDRIAEAVSDIDAEVIVNIQGDEPLMDPGVIDGLVDMLRERKELNMATAVTPLKNSSDLENPSVVKVVFNSEKEALYFSRSVIPFNRDGAGKEAEEGLYWRHIGIYAYRKKFLTEFSVTEPCLIEKVEKLEQLRALYMGAKIGVLITEYEGIGVDTPEDVRLVEDLIRRESAGEE